MTHIRYSEPPGPGDGKRWCLRCLMDAKRDIADAQPAGRLEQLRKDGKPGEHWLPWNSRAKLYPAITTGMTDIPQLGPVDVCFHHLAFFCDKPTSALAAPGPDLPPGLIRGTG